MGRIREITLHPNPVLHRPSSEVTEFDARLAGLVDDLFETMYAMDNGAGLAAPQIGVNRQVFVFDCGDERAGYVVNPVLDLPTVAMQDGSEGCLSIPGIWLETPRHAHARVTGVDATGAPVEYVGDELVARCFQHEVDHLDGTLFISHQPAVRRKNVDDQLTRTSWFGELSMSPRALNALPRS